MPGPPEQAVIAILDDEAIAAPAMLDNDPGLHVRDGFEGPALVVEQRLIREQRANEDGACLRGLDIDKSAPRRVGEPARVGGQFVHEFPDRDAKNRVGRVGAGIEQGLTFGILSKQPEGRIGDVNSFDVDTPPPPPRVGMSVMWRFGVCNDPRDGRGVAIIPDTRVRSREER